MRARHPQTKPKDAAAEEDTCPSLRRRSVAALRCVQDDHAWSGWLKPVDCLYFSSAAGSRLADSTSLKYFTVPTFSSGGGGVVADDHAVRVQLQGGDGPHVVDAVLDELLQRAGLVVAVDDDRAPRGHP